MKTYDIMDEHTNVPIGLKGLLFPLLICISIVELTQFKYDGVL